MFHPKSQINGKLTRPRFGAGRNIALLILLSFLLIGCNERERSKSEPYYAEATPPRLQEFRWSNGRIPKSLDPAKATAPPETDLVRAVFEGLTELDSATLDAMPAVAERWTASEDFRTWTFQLRADARWSNGRPISAEDFVRSWKRLGQLSESAHRDPLTNLVGFPVKQRDKTAPVTQPLPSPTGQDALPSPTASIKPDQVTS